MSGKQWWSTIVHEYEFLVGNYGVPYTVGATVGSTILRTLVHLSVSATQLAVPNTHLASVPRVNLSIGYDPASDHANDHITPRNTPTFDWLFDTGIPWQSINRVDTGTTADITYAGGMSDVASAEGQRKITGPNVNPFYVLWLAVPVPTTPDIVVYHGCLHIRTLVHVP